MQEMLARMGELSRQRNLPILVAYLSYRTDFDVRPELVQRLVVDNGLDFFDVSQAFDGKNRKQFRIYLTDSHLNVDAHRIFAESLYPEMLPKVQALATASAD